MLQTDDPAAVTAARGGLPRGSGGGGPTAVAAAPLARQLSGQTAIWPNCYLSRQLSGQKTIQPGICLVRRLHGQKTVCTDNCMAS